MKTKLAFLTLVIICLFSCEQRKTQVLSPINNKEFGGDFSLKSTKGDWRLKENQDRASILYFGFTHCPDICPMALSLLNKELKNLTKKQREKVRVIFISVDHKRDSEKTAQEYANFFNKDFIGLSGTKEQIDQVTKKYGVFYEFTPLKDSELEYTVDHSSRFFILDKQGKYLNSFTNIKDNHDFINTIKKALGE